MIFFQTFIRIARPAFFNFAVAFILFWLPIEFLYRFTSWILFMPAIDMIKETAMMTLLLTLISLVFALMIGLTGAVLARVLKVKKIDDLISNLLPILVTALIMIMLFISLKKWLEIITGNNINLGAAKLFIPLIIIGFFSAISWKYGLAIVGRAIQSNLIKGNKAALFLISVSGLTIAVNGIYLHDFNEINNNQISPLHPAMPNVILLSIDTLTAEDMSLYGYHLPTTPNLDAFAKESYVFDNFFSSSNWTTPSVASFISGQYPITNGVHQIFSYFLENDRKKNLGQVLKTNGYQTVAVVANGFANPLLLNISNSFSATTELPLPKHGLFDIIGEKFFQLENYRTFWWLEDLEQPFKHLALVLYGNEENSLYPPELVFNRALPFLTTLKRPNFVWTHIIPPHEPFLPAAPFKYQFLKSKAFSTLKDYGVIGTGTYPSKQQAEVDQQRLRYDEYILDTDSRVGDFLEKLKTMGHFDDSIIIITADHGESFTKNFLYHGGPYLHQPLIHIPLLIHLPGQKEGKHIDSYAGQVDLLPTIADLLDIPMHKWVEGESLKPIMLEGKYTTTPKFSMNLDADSRFAPPCKGTIAVMQDGWKLVRYLSTGKEELYHLAIDPEETTNLANINLQQTKKMRELIYARFKLTK